MNGLLYEDAELQAEKYGGGGGGTGTRKKRLKNCSARNVRGQKLHE
jgi:hypothetical protein